MAGVTRIDISRLKDVKERLFSAFVKKQTNRLLEYAPLQLANAYNSKTFKNKTWNLSDSYVWVVYYKGNIEGSGYLWNNRVSNIESNFHHTKVNGRKIAQDFIDQYKSTFTSGWEIVWAATAPYSTYLENGANGLKFYVISSIYDEVASDFKGKAKVNFIIDK